MIPQAPEGGKKIHGTGSYELYGGIRQNCMIFCYLEKDRMDCSVTN